MAAHTTATEAARLDICQVLASTGDGGLEKHVRELSAELAHAGHRVHVMAPAGFIATLPATLHGHALPLQHGRLNLWSLLRLAREIRRHGCDIVHAHASKAAFMTGLIRPFLSCPTVATVHNIKRSQSAYLRHDRIIAVSRALSETLPAEITDVVYHGIAPPTAQALNLRQHFGLPAGQPVLLAVGRLVPAKGFDILIRAVSGLPVSVLIAGDGPQRPALETMTRDCPAPTVIRLLGHRDDVADLIANSDAVIISSRREGFSYVFGETALLHKPVLSTDVPIPNEVLPRELIVPTESVSDLRGRLTTLLQDRPAWQHGMTPAFEFAEGQLTLQAMTERTLAVYRTVLDI